MIYNIDGISRTIELVEDGGYKKEVKEIKHDKKFKFDIECESVDKAIALFKSYNIYPIDSLVYLSVRLESI